jgi:hypothetical protein
LEETVANEKESPSVWGKLVSWFGAVIGIVHRFMTIEEKVSALDKKVAHALAAHTQLVHFLLKVGVREEGQNAKAYLQELIVLSESFTRATIEHERVSKNPLLPEELTRLEWYMAHLKSGGWLDVEQAKDFDYLGKKLEEDHRAKGSFDIGAAIIGGIAAMILGIVLANVSNESEKKGN